MAYVPISTSTSLSPLEASCAQDLPETLQQLEEAVVTFKTAVAQQCQNRMMLEFLGQQLDSSPLKREFLTQQVTTLLIQQLLKPH